MVWRCRGAGLGGAAEGFCSRKVWRGEALVPGCLYTVEMSILKVPMWLIRKARLRLWTTCVDGDDTCELFLEQGRYRGQAGEDHRGKLTLISMTLSKKICGYS